MLEGVLVDGARSAATRPTSSARRSGRTTPIPTALVLLLGTMFAPVADRGAPGMGFTHKTGDIVDDRDADSSAGSSTGCARATNASAGPSGRSALMRNLARRGLI